MSQPETGAHETTCGNSEAARWRERAESLQRQLDELREACDDRTAFEHTGTAMMVIEDDMTVSAGNRTMERMTGWSHEEVRRGHRWTDYVHPDDLPRMIGYHRLRRERPDVAPSSYEFRLREPGGGFRPVLVNVAMVPGTRKSIVSLVDISERKAMEEALRASEQRFKETAELLPAIICEVGPDRRFTYVNQRGLRQFGYTAEDIAAGLSVDAVADPGELERITANFRAVLGGALEGPREYLMRHRDGTRRYYLLESAAIVRDGRPVGVRTCLLDIHERKLAEQRVAESEERFRSLFTGSPIGIALFARDGHCVDANGSFRGLFGLTAAATPPALSALVELSQEHHRTLSSGTTVRVEATRENQSGGQRFFEWHISPLGQTLNAPGMLLAQVVDVTAQREAEVRRLEEMRRSADEARRLLADMRKEMTHTFTFRNMVSRSPAMRAVFDMLPIMAETSATVLVYGESGTGKELIARALHELSPRNAKPFVAINCGALPDTLLESELFGYKAGAFTDARKDKPGKFAYAEGGTLFLDEIGDISPSMQVKLLRVLQDRTYEPLGANTPVRADVRIVAATNRDLPALIKEGKFREDLYYRIKVLQVTLPPLRERLCDIPLLCEYFIERFNARYGRRVKGLSQEALDALLAHSYPGNIRELENIIEHAFVFCRAETIAPEHLPSELRGPLSTRRAAEVLAGVRNFDELEKVFLESVLNESGGNKLQAARRLGVHKATLFRKLKRLGIGGRQARAS